MVRKHACSSKGQFETAPSPSDPKTIRFAYTGDETAVTQPGHDNPFWGHFRAFKSITGGSLTVAYKKADGSTVTDIDGTPCGPYTMTR